LIVRTICENYHCLPSDVEDLTLDQIITLTMDRDRLARAGQLWRTTPAALARAGAIDRTPGGSLVQRLRAAKRAAAATVDRRARRQRRAARRAELLRLRERGEIT